jgi:hypothetical protein
MLCECGCGQPAPIAKRTQRSFGWVKGQPLRFVRGHKKVTIAPPNPSGICQCGCGQPAPIATASSTRYGHLRNHPVCFILGHRARKHGGIMERVRTPEYGSYGAMKHRCLNPKNLRWSFYGGAGVKICDRWLGEKGFENFLADLGPRPAGTTLGRFGDVGNYEPGNCAWQTSKEQRVTQTRKREQCAKAA